MHTIAISLLAEVGLQGPQAEVALRHALSNLASPSAAARRTLSEVGLEVEELDPSLKSLPEIVRRLADAGLDAEAARVVFDDKGAPAMLALIHRVEQLEALRPT